jgi:hypothetical protein
MTIKLKAKSASLPERFVCEVAAMIFSWYLVFRR